MVGRTPSSARGVPLDPLFAPSNQPLAAGDARPGGRARTRASAPQTDPSRDTPLRYTGLFTRAIGAKLYVREDVAVDALVERLDTRLRQWKPETAAQVRARVAEVIELADHDVLDLMRPRAIEQEVLDLVDEATTG